MKNSREVHPAGTAARIARLERAVRIRALVVLFVRDLIVATIAVVVTTQALKAFL